MNLRRGVWLDIAMMRIFHRVPAKILARRYCVTQRSIRNYVTWALQQDNETAAFLRSIRSGDLPEPGEVEYKE